MSKLKFAGRKWDARKWTREQKIQWQEKAFELGYSRSREGVNYLDSTYYTTNKDGSLYRSWAGCHFPESSGELLTFGDIFPEEEEDEKLDVIKEITGLFSERLLEEDVSDEEERGFRGLVYVEPEFKDSNTYFSILRKNCTEPQWKYLLDTLDLFREEPHGMYESLQNCGDGDGWFDCSSVDDDDVVVSFNDLFQYEDELCSVQ